MRISFKIPNQEISPHKIRFQRQRHEEYAGRDDDDGGAGGHVEVVSEQEARDAGDEGGEDGDGVILLDVLRDIARGGGWQDEQGVDDQDADPLDADGNDDCEERRKRALDPE